MTYEIWVNDETQIIKICLDESRQVYSVETEKTQNR